MNLTEMITLVRGELEDETAPYQWSDAALARHVSHTLREISEKIPLPATAILPTTAGSRDLDISGLTDRIMVQAVEYPRAATPAAYQRFAIWGERLNIISGPLPDGGNCAVYYGKLHTIDESGSTLPAKLADMVATGASARAAISRTAGTINRINIGGRMTSDEYRTWGNERLVIFQERLRRLDRHARLRTQQLFPD